VRLAVENMVVEGIVGSLPAYIYEGSLKVGKADFDNLIELSSSYADLVRFKMMLSEDARVVVVSGTKMTLLVESPFRYVESVD
jgi:hypothetical protein